MRRNFFLSLLLISSLYAACSTGPAPGVSAGSSGLSAPASDSEKAIPIDPSVESLLGDREPVPAPDGVRVFLPGPYLYARDVRSNEVGIFANFGSPVREIVPMSASSFLVNLAVEEDVGPRGLLAAWNSKTGFFRKFPIKSAVLSIGVENQKAVALISKGRDCALVEIDGNEFAIEQREIRRVAHCADMIEQHLERVARR